MHLHGGSVPHGNVDLSSRLRRNCPLNFVALAFQSAGTHGAALGRGGRRGLRRGGQLGALNRGDAGIARGPQRAAIRTEVPQIGRASCRERGEISVVAVSLKKKKEDIIAWRND